MGDVWILRWVSFECLELVHSYRQDLRMKKHFIESDSFILLIVIILMFIVEHLVVIGVLPR